MGRINEKEEIIDDNSEIIYTKEELTSKTVVQLKEIADKRNIEYSSNILKADLINLILGEYFRDKIASSLDIFLLLCTAKFPNLIIYSICFNNFSKKVNRIPLHNMIILFCLRIF